MTVRFLLVEHVADLQRKLRSMNFIGLRANIFSMKWSPTPAIILSLALVAAGNVARAEDPRIASRRASERLDFNNDLIQDGFFKIAFRAELQIGAQTDRVRKFDEPVRIFIDNRARPDRSSRLAEIVADIRSRIKHLDIEITQNRRAANFIVALVADRNVSFTIRSRYGNNRAREIQSALNPQCLSGIGKDQHFRIRRAEAILPVDAGEFTFYDCAYEELLQGLGAINDDPSIPWTMFNDGVQMGFFDVYDQYLLNILYDPRVRPGMRRKDVKALMPDLLATARAWVTRVNGLDRAATPDASHASAEAAALANGHPNANRPNPE